MCPWYYIQIPVSSVHFCRQSSKNDVIIEAPEKQRDFIILLQGIDSKCLYGTDARGSDLISS
jgi:hypothetical protein